ncbi:MAG: hypothetical protein J6W98_01265 [Bacteroidales bacterium]|nr:hypothetical protein [Bacteroidales bacterium]
MRKPFSLPLLLLVAGLSSCNDYALPYALRSLQRGQGEEVYYANFFARNALQTYYLWDKEVSDKLENWQEFGDPAAQVLGARYRDASGKEIDRWTQLVPDFARFQASVAGNSPGTYGYDFQLTYLDKGHTRIGAVLICTYADGPASRAGLKRGDVIVQVNGKAMTPDNYVEIVQDELLGTGHLVLTLESGRELSMDSVSMYENPVLLYKIFDDGSKRVAYLAYNSFTLDSYQDLITACKGFRAAGISDLILDLRYNGGGFTMAEEFLASMLAPEDAVQAGEVLSMEVYNSNLMEYFASRKEDTKTYFSQDFRFQYAGKNYQFNTRDANARAGRIFAIVTGSSASASEALLCDLKAYMPVILVGGRTHGKFCAGLPLSATDFYTDNVKYLGSDMVEDAVRSTRNMGLYVMISRFSDKNGETLCMPDGLAPDVTVEDNPLDGCQLGDPSETMLAAALSACGYAPAKRAARDAAVVRQLDAVTGAPARAGDGYRILLDRPSLPVE